MYYIYHIEGVKIGCSTQVEKRVKEQGYNNFEILEEHIDIYEASDREIQLQKQYGYKVDTNAYWESSQKLRKNATFASASKGGKIGGKTTGQIHLASGHWKKFCSLGGKTGAGGKVSGRLTVESGRIKEMSQKAKEKLSKPIIAFKNNIEIEYNSISDAGRELEIKIPNIVAILKGRQKTAKGYTFKYKIV
jgi:hypothetical protein